MSVTESLSNIPAERGVLSGLIKYGKEAYLDVADILQSSTFTVPYNISIYACLEHLFKQDVNTIDLPSICSAAQELGLSSLIEKNDSLEHIRALFEFFIEIKNVRAFAAKIRKLEIARLLHNQLEQTQDKVLEVTGNESITSILGIAEDSIFDFTSLLNDNDSDPVLIGDSIYDYIRDLGENPIDQIGIATGFHAWDKAIGGGLRPGTVNVISARPKALRYGSKVYTSNGPVNIEDVSAGDKVLHPFSGETTVVETWDHKDIDIYRVYFRDGDYVDCCEDHLWEVYKRWPSSLKIKDKTPFVKSVKELIGDIQPRPQNYKWDVRLPEPILFEDKPVELHPYVVGLLIGDGSFGNSICFHTADDELIEHIKDILGDTYDIKIDWDHDSKCTSYRINGLQPIIRSLGLFKKTSHFKFIPKQYIYNSIETRLWMLRGLMDTDGDCCIDKRSKNSRSRFCTASIQLAKDVKEIVHSLGGICSINKTYTPYKGENKLYYRCEIRMSYNPFNLTRKAEKVLPRKIGELKRTIVKIEKLNEKDNARCLTLENNDGLFMTDNYVVTHNTGKTLLTDNMGYYIAQKGIPVLNLDTEMTIDDHKNRTMAMLTESYIYNIETGQYSEKPGQKEKILQAAKEFQAAKVPYYHISIAGTPFEEQLSILRRWIVKSVGLNSDGTAKPCVVMYDYLKLMTADGISSSLQEYQLLGFMMTALHNFAVRYKVPILTLMQLNRDGITQESTSSASGSDRIIWLCSNFTIFKAKSDEEIAEDGTIAGNRKLVVLAARHGEGTPNGDYINCEMKGWCGKITEGKTKFELSNITPFDAKPPDDIDFA